MLTVIHLRRSRRWFGSRLCMVSTWLGRLETMGEEEESDEQVRGQDFSVDVAIDG